ncbi:hypothetical protein [Dissulfurispira sp.]|uniref:hypothetical protein n=1 Tax=Dissulfurispira sp. TaxID=2817609 RepID=UPI002FDA7E5C
MRQVISLCTSKNRQEYKINDFGLIVMSCSDFIIGREKELQALIAHIMDRKNLHIYGSEGAGKSILLDWIYSKFKELDDALIPVYCRNSRTLREIVLQTAGFLLGHFKHLKSVDKFKNVKKIENPADIRKLNIRVIKNIVFAYMPKGKFCVILDHLEYVTPRINSLLTALYERVPVITASRQSWDLEDYAFRGNLAYCLYLAPKLRIENLKRKDAFYRPFRKNRQSVS